MRALALYAAVLSAGLLSTQTARADLLVGLTTNSGLTGVNIELVGESGSAYVVLGSYVSGTGYEPENITGKEWESKVKGRSGIIYFENYWHRKGETKTATGDHIDLWNGSKLTPNAANNVRRLGLNSIQWLPWPLDGFNFSDLGNSTKILFWEVK